MQEEEKYLTLGSIELIGNAVKEGYVGKEQGKSLVSDTEITKLEHIPQNAEENAIETISVNGITQQISNKNVNIEIPPVPDVSNFITKDVNNLTYYELATATGNNIQISIDSSTYVVTLNLKNSAGTVLSTGTVDLPLESVVVNGSYDSTNKKVILTLQSGSTIEFSVADLVAGLQSEITSNNKLASDLVDDTNQANKFVTASEKQTWNGKEDTSNKVIVISSNSTNTEYPTALAVYNLFTSIVNGNEVKY